MAFFIDTADTAEMQDLAAGFVDDRIRRAGDGGWHAAASFRDRAERGVAAA